MIESLFIKDTVTGDTLIIIRQSPAIDYCILKNGIEFEEVKGRSIRKVIRTWMKGRKTC